MPHITRKSARLLCLLALICLPGAQTAIAESAPNGEGAADAGTATPPADPADHPAMRGALNALDAWVEGMQHYKRVPGISVGVVHDQQLLWSKGYGVSNLATARPADADTLYSICSISKLFTAIGIMQLRDAGALSLRDPVADHLDWFNIKRAHAEGGTVRVGSLLTHSSGLPRESDFPYWNGPDFPFPTREALIAQLASQSTLYPTQTRFQYSNLALTLAGEIVQARSERDYAEYINEQILTPLRLSSTRTHYPEAMRGEALAIGYSGMHREQTRTPVEPFFTRGITAAAGFTSSVRDLARFASWQFRLLKEGGVEVLDANTLREMHRVRWVDPDWETTWGIGFSVRKEKEHTVVGHGGGCPGYITSFSMVPSKQLGVVVLTNAGDGPAERIARNARAILLAALGKAKTPVTDPVPDFSRFEGNYEMRPWGGETAIRQSGSHLLAIDLPSEDLARATTRLKHREGNLFTRLSKQDEPLEDWEFIPASDGSIERLRIHSIYATRID